MAETRAAREENLLFTVKTRCALCALRRSGPPRFMQEAPDGVVNHALLIVSPVADEQMIDRLVAEALHYGMALVDVRTGAGSRIHHDVLPRDIQYRSSITRNNVLSDRRLLAFLRDHAVVHLFMPGSPAEASVKRTALSALGKGYRVTIVEDPARPRSSKVERITQDFESRGIFTITAQQFEGLAATTRKADALRALGSRTPLHAFSGYGRGDDVAKADEPGDVPTAREPSASASRAGATDVDGPRRRHWIGWMAPAALAAAAIVWPSHPDIDIDGALRTTANRLATVFASPPAITAAAIEQEPPHDAASLAQRDDHRLAIDLSHDLAALRTEFDAAVQDSARASDRAQTLQLASERSLVEMMKELRREQEKTASLASELSTVLEELDRQKGEAAKYAAASHPPVPPPAAGPLEAADRSPPANGLAATGPPRGGPERATMPADPGQSPSATQPSGSSVNEDLPRLMARASQLLGHGDISAARTVLERVADAGDALALFALAETYDPQALAAMGTLGTVGDAAKARSLYIVALAKGVEKASGRLRSLQSLPTGAAP